jgi:hypothetical protein
MPSKRKRPKLDELKGLKQGDIVQWSDLNDVADVPAQKSMPVEWRTLLEHPRVVFTAPRDAKPRLERVAGTEESWSLELPATAQLDLPLLKWHRVPLKSARRKSNQLSITRAYRPPWVPQQLLPRIHVPAGRPYLRSLDGSVVTPSFSGIFGPDDRREFLPYGFPWQCIGRVVTRVAGKFFSAGSAVLVGPRHVLTASHVLPWNRTSVSVKFTAGFYDGQSILGAGAESFATEALAWKALDQVSAYDTVVVRLADPLGEMFGFWGTMAYRDVFNDKPVWTRLGYPDMLLRGGQWVVNTGPKSLAQANIAVLETDSDGDAMELKHHGDATEGDSGGPLMGLSVQIPPPGRSGVEYLPMVVGVTSGRISRSDPGNFWEWDKWNVAAGGAALVKLVSLSRTMWT